MKRVLVLALVLLARAPTARGDEPAPETRVRVEWAPNRIEVWAGEPFVLRLRVSVEDPAWFKEHALPLHAQPLDLPVEVEAAGWPDFPGTTPLADVPGPDVRERPRWRLVLGGRAVEGRVEEQMTSRYQPVHAVDLERRVSVAEAGTLTLPAPTLKFAHASRFATDALGERVPIDRTETVVRGSPGAVTVRALPDEGRPADFTGAVGQLRLTASVDRSEVRAGEPFRLTLEVTGPGNLETLVPPRPGDVQGLHVFSVEDFRGVTRRTLTYEVAVQAASMKEVPAFALAYFDPGPPARYDTARSAPIPLTVRSQANVKDIGNETICDFGPGPRVPPWAIALTVGVLVGLFAAGWARVRRSRRRSTDSPNLARRQAALAALRAAAARAGADLAPAFTEVVAAQLSVPHAAAIGPNVATRLARSGVEAEVAARAAATLERLVAARYGGEPVGPELAAEALTLAERLSGLRG